MIEKICGKKALGRKNFKAEGREKRLQDHGAKISYLLSRGLGMSLAEIARHVGVCTSTVFKAIQKLEQ